MNNNERSFEGTNTQPCPVEEEGTTAAYALGTLTAAELSIFEAHLPTCTICQAALQEYQETTAQLALLESDNTIPELSADLRNRILAQLHSEKRAPMGSPSPITDYPRGTDRSQRLIRLLAVAAVLLLLTTGGLLGWNWQLQRENQHLVVERDTARRELAFTRWAIQGTAPAITGEVLYLHNQHQAIVTISGLPPLQPGQVYQLWLIRDGAAPQPETVFLTQDTAVQADFTTFNTIAITIESGPHGSTTPTMPMLATGSLTR